MSLPGATPATPKYRTGQVVYVSLYNEQGDFKNDLARGMFHTSPRAGSWCGARGIPTGSGWSTRSRWAVMNRFS